MGLEPTIFRLGGERPTIEPQGSLSIYLLCFFNNKFFVVKF